MIRSALLWFSENSWCRNTLPRYGFVRRAVRRFMPGETLDDALGAARSMAERHRIPVLITLLGENVADEAEAREVADHYIHAAKRVAASGLDAELSLKPTHLGLDLGFDVAERNIRRVAEAAEAHGNWVWLDMEYSRYVDPTLELYRALRADHTRVGICLQSYLHRTPDDLESLIPTGAAIRLVKGAYAEPPEIALPVKADVDRAFFDQARRMLAPRRASSRTARRAGDPRRGAHTADRRVGRGKRGGSGHLRVPDALRNRRPVAEAPGAGGQGHPRTHQLRCPLVSLVCSPAGRAPGKHRIRVAQRTAEVTPVHVRPPPRRRAATSAAHPPSSCGWRPRSWSFPAGQPSQDAGRGVVGHAHPR